MTLNSSNFTVNNATSTTDIVNLDNALLYLSGSATGEAVLEGAASNGTNITIIHNGDLDQNGVQIEDGYDDNTNTIYWNPNSAFTVLTNANIGTVGVQSAALGLLHESAHATDPNYVTDINTPNAQYDDNAEAYAVGKEDIVAAYVARVSLADPSILTEQGRMSLEPGMAVTAEIKTGQRRLISYLLSPLLAHRQESMRER